MFDLSGKVAILTAASSEIGRRMALGLAKQGASVVVTARSLNKLEVLAKEIQDLGYKALAISSDVMDEKSVTNMVERVMSEFSHIDILVNGAAEVLRIPAEEFPIEQYRKNIDLNITGTFICCQAVGKVMIKQKSGRIINISSVRGRYGALMYAAAYASSKGGVNMLTRQLACEWAKYDISVNAIAPVIIDLGAPIPSEISKYAKEMISRIPKGRWARPEDIIAALIFLASDESSYFTGQILYIDGGATACF